MGKSQGSSDFKVLRKLKILDIRFKEQDRFVRIQEIKILEHSGYLLFESFDKTTNMYISTMGNNRKEILKNLVEQMLNKLEWSSKVNLMNIHPPKKKR